MKRPITARAPTDAQLAALEAETRPAPRERPLIVRAEEVRGLLDGTVTQIWRPVRGTPDGLDGAAPEQDADEPGLWYSDGGLWIERSPFGAPGDRIWCRETWADVEPLAGGRVEPWERIVNRPDGSRAAIWYRAEGEIGLVAKLDPDGPRWSSPVSMPRWACRLVLTVERIEVRRVSTATNADAEAAGFRDGHGADERGTFATSALGNFQADWSKHYPGTDWAWVATVRRIDAGTGREPRCHWRSDAATCFGDWASAKRAYSCDACCDHGGEDSTHGNEDGHCERLPWAPERAP